MDRADMTHPLTPREKVARAIQTHDNDHVPDGYANGLSDEVSDWSAYLADRVLTALASGSGDHAELARLADDLRKFEHHSVGSLKISMDEVRRIIAVCDAHAALLTENAALRAACSKSNDEISQTLGKALGYPWFKDDQINFPGATAENGVCVGDHVAESLADEAARRITEAERKLAEEVGLLRPFSEAAESLDDETRDHDHIWEQPAAMNIDAGHLRAARTFLSKEAERG